MSYIINTYNGTQLTVVEDGTVDNTTELTFIGKNYSGYGTLQNENFLYMLENFANASAPSKPITGQLWFDSSANKLKLYDKNLDWRTISGADISTAEPSYLTVGDFWFDTIKNQLYVYSSTGYVLVGPTDTSTTETVLNAVTVDGTDGLQHSIMTATVGGSVIFTVSKDTFTLKSTTTPIADFSEIHSGITLANTDASTGTNPGFTNGIPRYYGTATNTETIQVKNPSTGAIVKQVATATIDIPIITDKTSIVARDSIGNINATTLTGIATKSNTLKVDTSYVSATIAIPSIPDKTSIVARDSSGNIYANTLLGTATNANFLELNGQHYGASVTTLLNSTPGINIAARDTDGSLTASTFNGTATSAKYADLAEKYLADQKYEVGTVMMVGGDKEVTASEEGSKAIGVISANPGFMMNRDLDGGTYVALKGRVPVKVTGKIIKGERLVPSHIPGIAIVGDASNTNVIGIALNSSDDLSIKLIEAVIL